MFREGDELSNEWGDYRFERYMSQKESQSELSRVDSIMSYIARDGKRHTFKAKTDFFWYASKRILLTEITNEDVYKHHV